MIKLAELIPKIAEDSGLTPIGASRALEQILLVISDALKAGDDVSLVGFGRFYIKETTEKKVFRPSTRQFVLIEARKVPAFKPGQPFKDKIN